MKRYEKESFLKSFLLFFTTLLLLNIVIFAFYYHEQETTLNENIFNKIKLFNYTFENKDIHMDVVPLKPFEELYTLTIDKGDIFAYFDIPNSKENTLKLSYDKQIYQADIKDIRFKTILYFLISSFILFSLSMFYSWYALTPLKNALHLLEEFLKDIIHDLNTPVTSILLNLKILQKKASPEAIERIEYSAKNISSLYGNLEATIKNEPLELETIDIEKLLQEKIKYYQYLFPSLTFTLHVKSKTLQSSHKELSRILDNLISNACKYNKQNGFVSISTEGSKIIIEDSGIGIKNPIRVFERFYKESERGLGMGLHIVEKLCAKLNIKINILSNLNKGTKIELTLS